VSCDRHTRIGPVMIFKVSLAAITLLAVGGHQSLAASPARPASVQTREWAPENEYGEFLAAPSELASVPVNDIVKSIRLNGQAMRLGESVYTANCAGCHGGDLKGLPDMHTPDLTDNVWRFAGDDAESVGKIRHPSDVEWTVRYGVRSGHPNARGVEVSMLAYDPKFRTKHDTEEFGSAAFLTTTEISDMVEYVLELSGQPHDAVKANRAAPLFQDNTKGNCFDCHGRSGKGINTFGSTDLTKPSLYLYGADRASISQSITQGRHGFMPAFGSVLKPEQLKAVSVFVFAHAAE
jgi:cytochrome c oxidase cbb3-type subunit 3